MAELFEDHEPGPNDVVALRHEQVVKSVARKDISAANIGILFGLDASSILLQDTMGDRRVYFQEQGRFPGISRLFTIELLVTGQSQTPQVATNPPASNLRIRPIEPIAQPARPVSAPAQLGRKKNWQITIMEAKLHPSKLIPIPTSQMLVLPLNPETANQPYVLAKTRAFFAKDEYQLFLKNGCIISGQEATKNETFWKHHNKRQIFAAEPADPAGIGGPSAPKRRSIQEVAETLEGATRRLDGFMRSQEDARKLREYFQCVICHEVLTAPKVCPISMCRRMACTDCLQLSWAANDGGHDGPIGTCPNCRSASKREKFKLPFRGILDVLEVLRA